MLLMAYRLPAEGCCSQTTRCRLLRLQCLRKPVKLRESRGTAPLGVTALASLRVYVHDVPSDADGYALEYLKMSEGSEAAWTRPFHAISCSLTQPT